MLQILNKFICIAIFIFIFFSNDNSIINANDLLKKLQGISSRIKNY